MLRLGVVLATFRSRSERNRQRPPGYVRESLEKTDAAPRSAGIAHHLSLCAFWHFQSTRKASRQGMINHATHTTPRARESIGFFIGAYPRVLFTGSECHEWRFRRSELAQWAWRRKPRSGIRNPKKMRQEVGAGGNAAREGGRDACAGRSARSVVARHLKEPI